MEADTKNKRGRPRTIAGEMGRDFQQYVCTDETLRAATNLYYAIECLRVYYGDLKDAENGSFFLNENRKIRRRGIAEQIGRMLESELINEQEARELVNQCKKDYMDGKSVKEIEKTLRFIRICLKNQLYTYT